MAAVVNNGSNFSCLAQIFLPRQARDRQLQPLQQLLLLLLSDDVHADDKATLIPHFPHTPTLCTGVTSPSTVPRSELSPKASQGPSTAAGTAAPSNTAVALLDDMSAVDEATPMPHIRKSSCGCFLWLTKMQPTNYDMLIFRTLNRDLKRPNHNEDELAVRFRDELMPFRGFCLRNLPWTKYQFKNPTFGVPGCINFIDARTKFFDDAVKQATAAGITQVVVIAAGYDTRSLRLAQPGVTYFEIDLPSASKQKITLVKKLGLLPPGDKLRTNPVYVAADLSSTSVADALKTTSFDPTQPTLFTIEGIAAKGSRITFDFMHITAINGEKKYAGFNTTAKAVANKGEPYLFGLPDSPEGVQTFVAPHGFRLQQDMTTLMLPHVKWDEKVPPIASFYSYAVVTKPE
eukprot:gene20711-27521_t